MTHPRSTLVAWLLLALAAAPVAPAAAGDEERLTRALDTIEAHEIRSDIHFFASDEMRGRDTPSLELRVAARFVRARLERLGFRPGAGASFFHEYTRPRRRIDPERSRLRVEGPGGAVVELAFARDYFVPSSRDITDLEREGGLVWCGAGEREDFRGRDLGGRWAVCRRSELSARRRERYAEEAGAIGLVVLSDPAAEEDPVPEELARTTRYAREGLVDWRGSTSEKVFPQVHLGREASRVFLATVGSGSAWPAAGEIPGSRVRDVRAGSDPVVLENVCALWPGSDASLAREVLIVSAHYDHEGVKDGKIYPGADDNGSGSMGLLALAEALSVYGPMRRSVLLMWVSGEEKGLIGSGAWTSQPTLPEGHRAVCDLNIDMIGRNAPDLLLITPTRALKEYNGLTRLAESLAPLEGFPRLGSADDYWRRSDHMNFAKDLKIPVAFLFSDVHEDYHRPGDTPDKIDNDKVRRVTRLVLRMLDGLQADRLEL